MATILVVDDELGIRALLSEILADEGHTVELAENAAQARACRERIRPDLVLLDIWMPDVDGITLLKEWGSTAQLTMPVIMMSGHGTIDTAVEATKFGAMAFLEKPITLQKLLRAVEQGLVKPASRIAAAMREAGLTRPCSTARSSFCKVIGFSRKAMAPNFVASTAVSMVPWPLIMMTGIVSCAPAPHSLSSVMPSTSGIQMSSRTRSGRIRSRQARACAAFSASSTVWPSSEILADEG